MISLEGLELYTPLPDCRNHKLCDIIDFDACGISNFCFKSLFWIYLIRGIYLITRAVNHINFSYEHVVIIIYSKKKNVISDLKFMSESISHTVWSCKLSMSPD